MTLRNNPSLTLLAVVVVTITTAWCPLLHAEKTLQQRVDRLVQPYLDNEIVVGLTIGVLHDDKESFFGYGRMSQNDGRVPNADTIYEIGSTSKVFTGLLLADAVAHGHVRLDQAASELLPAGVSMPSHGEQTITLQHLATHVSGLSRLPDNLKVTDFENPYATYTLRDLYTFLNGHKLDSAPGERREYSNLGMGLLGHLLARRQNRTYEQLLRDQLASPLNMTSTTITLNERQRARLASPYSADRQPTAKWDLRTLAGAGAIRSTARDMLRLAKANLAPPEGKLGEAIELAWKVHQKPLVKGQPAMGLGWHVAGDGSTRLHNGQTGGYHSMFLISRKLNASVVLLTNTSTTQVDQLAQDILKVLAGATVEPRSFEKNIKVPREVMQRYVGRYELTPEIAFTVTLKDDNLMVKLTGQPAFRVYARSQTQWHYRVVPAKLTFEVGENGKCVALVLFQNGVRQKAKRVE
ncbi:MAG: serine hydrolase [Planctomycetes bacterium]|nr:serine hydrolase [Planctomycetota bacterium]